ncbi:MAG: hydantoinase B/oxoprolinase family protein, partial [Gaiellaceae bacterium]
AIEQITVKDGVNPAESVLVAGGGAAGLSIVPIARALGCERVLVPRTAGALSACGAQFSDIVAEFTGSQYAHTDHFDTAGVNETLAAIGAEMDDFASSLEARGIDEFERSWFVEARYLNQQWEMEAPLGVDRFASDGDVVALKGGFDTVHKRLYAVNDPDGPIECMNWKGRLTAVLPKPAEPVADDAAEHTPKPSRTTTAHFEGSGATDTRVYEGAELRPGDVIEGPAIIEEPTTTVVVYAGSTCRVTPTNNYLLDVDVEAETLDLADDAEIDPVQLAIMANRLDAILREMTETVVLTARSSVIGMARDFSCGINTSDDEVLALAAGLPMHIFGTHLQCKAMKREHPDFKEGDAFLHNDPYDGNSHPADHVTLVPVFHEGEHFFTVSVKCHVADTGNSLPTTYMASARDVYEEGTLIFPAVKVQDNYEDNDDIVRMCKRRIRVPEQWHGDYLSALGAARVGERGLKAFVAKYGKDTVRRFFTEWLDYTSRRVEASIKRMPKKQLTNSGSHDPVMPFLPGGIPIKVSIDVNPDAGTVTVDLRDNPDNLPVGMNLTEATATSGAAQAVFCCLDPDIQHNAGSFRHVKVLLREGCVVGIPKFPYSCSTATTNASDVVINLTQAAFADLGDGYGLSMANFCNSAGAGVVSGKDYRKDDAPYVNQIFIMGGGGPATPTHDGMNYVLIPPGLGLLYRDSVEVDEQRTPFLIESMRLVPDSAGAGRQRGGAGTEVIYGARQSTVTVVDICNGIVNVPRGVRGGHDAKPASNVVIRADGTEEVMDNFFLVELEAGDRIRATDNGGSGYGPPTDRDPERVFEDVLERYVTVAAARDVYGVVISGDVDADTLALDVEATTALRG